MTARLRMPFRSLSADNFISRGSAGQVFAINENVVFKCPTIFENPVRAQAEEMKESIKKLENEKAICQILMKRWHPNIVCGLLCIPEGIFLHRQEMTLETCIERSQISAISASTQERWIQQITSALAWIEHLGYAHGDLRPANIFLGSMEEVRLGDFDATVKRGEQLVVASEPFCKMDEDFEPPLAGPLSEQFSLASCIYTIRFGHKPFHDIEAPIRVRRLIMNQFPSTAADPIFGELTQACWHGGYISIEAVYHEVVSLLEKHTVVEKHFENDTLFLDDIKAQCTTFLEMDSTTSTQYVCY
ncbi:kinase-like domain-containing protein [Ampelomyces quisqualis]|uniref:Kinase-like domain-containing protein n=1 Tax=Ampelomyces quisqualis TaxID=50730 RepID=A0A6A5R2S9_AMPQU|nr:kinase-like domain-containing protein [Ampelomyces quisqualis]